MHQLILIAPEIFLSALALLLLLGEAFIPAPRKIWLYVAIAGLISSCVYIGFFFFSGSIPGASALGISPSDVQGGWIRYTPVLGMVAVDSLAIFFKLALGAAVVLVLWLSTDYPEFKDLPLGSYAALLLLATVGMMFLVSSNDLLLAVIALELLSITSFILTGFAYHRRSSSEGAIKFLLVGTFSTGVFLFGISYYYGYFGTTSIQPLLDFPASGQQPDMILTLILVLLIVGIGFKLAMVPFHMWAPDAYEGAPTPITAFLSVAPKAAAIGFLLRLLSQHAALGITPVLAVLAAVTMTVGNVGALPQTNVKRLLAYSSIAQVGYILVAMVGGGAMGGEATMVYTFVYIFMNMGVFAVLMIVSRDNRNEEMPTFAGLSERSPWLALALVIFLLSLTGIPPLAGFVGKFAIFASIIHQPGLLWLAIVAVLNSVISLFYYFRIVQQMYFRDASDKSQLGFGPAVLCCLLVALGVTLIGGILPDHILGWVRNVIGS